MYSDGPDCPLSAPDTFVAPPFDVVLGWMPEDRPWLGSGLSGWAFMAGYALADPIANGSLRYLPTRLSAVPRLLHHMRPDIAVIPAVRRGGELAHNGSVGWAPLVSAFVRQVVAEVDEQAVDVGGPPLIGPIDRIVTVNRGPSMTRSSEPSTVDRTIAEHVLTLLPNEATLQLGLGVVPDAIALSLDRPVSVWSGLLTEAVAVVAGRGLLREPAVGAYAWGGSALVNLCRSGGIRLTSIAETHDPSRIATKAGFVAVNTALQVGLDGSVNVERVGGRLVAGMGGHPDFCAAAAHAPGGLSVIALHASRRGRSTIVANVETVSTPRCDIDVVVTEHGIADLRGLDDAERALRITGIAAPQHRAELERTRSTNGRNVNVAQAIGD